MTFKESQNRESGTKIKWVSIAVAANYVNATYVMTLVKTAPEKRPS